jgi:hypothetical protein
MIPETTLSGKFVRCLFGITDCTFSADPSASENQAGRALAGEGNPDKPTDPVEVTEIDEKTGQPKRDKKGNPITHKESINLKDSADFMKRLVGNVGKALNSLNLLATLDAFSKLHEAIHNGELSKGVAVARGIQAMGLYQTFKTARDQIKTGEVSGPEVNEFMQVIGTAAGSEGWTEVVAGQGDPSKLTQTSNPDPKRPGSKEYCEVYHQEKLQYRTAQSNKEFAYLCPDKQIGGGSNAASLEGGYNESVGKVISPVVAGWQQVRKLPILGSLLNLFEQFSTYFAEILSRIVNNIFKLAGVRDNVYAAIQWMVKRTLAFLGAGPIMTGEEGAGQYMNWLVQGGAYTAEATARANGASATNTESRVAAHETLDIYDSARREQMSKFEKYLAFSNPDSPAAKATFSFSQLNSQSVASWLTNFGSIFKNLASAITMPFGYNASAAKINGYAGAQFAGIRTYDFPRQCLDIDPLSTTPANSTNIQQVLGDKVDPKDLTWDLVTNNTAWYDYIYSKVDSSKVEDQAKAESIYNCSLLDTSIRGALGYTHGYNKDNGLNDSGDSAAVMEPVGGGPVSGTSQDLAQQILASSKISFTTKLARQAMAAAAQGKPSAIEARCATGKTGAVLSPVLLGVILKIAESHSIAIGYLTNGCHSPISLHYVGKAVDLNQVDGRASTGGAADRPFMHEVTGILPNGSEMGQVNCSTVPINPINKVELVKDSCNHIHFGVP